MSKFNKKLWTLGNKIEDELKPHLEEFLGKELYRSDDIYDIMDFKSEDNKLVVEIKGRRVKSTQYDTTIITCGKIIEAEKLMCIDENTKVYLFLNNMMNSSFKSNIFALSLLSPFWLGPFLFIVYLYENTSYLILVIFIFIITYVLYYFLFNYLGKKYLKI